MTNWPAPTLDLTAPVRDVAFGVKRQTIYLSQPDSDRVLVLPLSTMAWAPPIALAGRPQGLDLTPGEDSLVVALRATRRIALVSLVDAPHVVRTDTVPASGTTIPGNPGPDFLRIGSAGKALVSTTSDSAGLYNRLFTYDVATGAFDGPPLPNAADVTEYAPLARSADGRLIAVNINVCCPNKAQVYDAQTNAFLAATDVANDQFLTMTVDSTGSRALVGANLLDQARWLSMALYPYGTGRVSGLSMDGNHAYFGAPEGVLHVSLRDSLVTELMSTPAPPTRILTLPGTAKILVLMDGKLALLRTSGATMASAARMPAEPQSPPHFATRGWQVVRRSSR
jgi:hypothetical protein